MAEFDGVRFVNENPPETQLWLDWVRDFYAAQSHFHVPDHDGRRIVIGWISNRINARQTPTSPSRGAQSIPRELRLEWYREGLRLTQRPVREIESPRGEAIRLAGLSIEAINCEITAAGFKGSLPELQAEIEVGDVRDVGFRVLQGTHEETLVRFTTGPAEVYIDRSESGPVEFHAKLTGRHSTRLDPQDGRVKLRILVDRSVLELVTGDGRMAFTDRVFPQPSSTGLSMYANGGTARLVSLEAWKLRLVWN